MFKLSKQFFLFLLPILRKAVIQVAAEELNKLAYPSTTRRRRPYTSYNRRASSNIFTEYAKKDAKLAEDLYRMKTDQFHDVLMVAFDITGPNTQMVQQWFQDNLPKPEDSVLGEDSVAIDAWWIADDNVATSDCDSAVFVSQGNQEKARKLLIEHGLAN